MTKEESKREQENLASEGWDLAWWYGIHCEKCCGVFPRLIIKGGFDPVDCSYKCEVCGKQTKYYSMPWQAEKAWNSGEFISEQIRLF